MALVYTRAGLLDEAEREFKHRIAEGQSEFNDFQPPASQYTGDAPLNY